MKSAAAAFPSSDVGVFGDEGSAMVTGSYEGVAVKLWGKDEAPASAYVDVAPQPADVSAVQYENFLAALAHDREPSPNAVDGLKAVQVALAMQESAATGKAMELG